jgi:hypothetical protein
MTVTYSEQGSFVVRFDRLAINGAAAGGPYPNPSNPGANDVSILVHYCASGASISAQVYNSLGYAVGGPSLYVSDGQIWDRLPITAPGTSGSYYIVVSVGSYSTTLGYSVY